MIISTHQQNDYYANGQLAYTETKAILNPTHAHLYPNYRKNRDGADWIWFGKRIKYYPSGQINWIVTYDDKGSVITNECFSYREDGSIRL